jgi:N6-L-threonylcarbamoyladenine synthase
MVVLGIESSCDDTAAAVVDATGVCSNVVSSQVDIHDDYGGVVPELASRDHQRAVVPVVQRALSEADRPVDAVEAVAVTHGPGLPGSLLVGLSFGKALAQARALPLLGVNHLEGHVYSVDLTGTPPPRPFLCLIVSGGHTELVRVGPDFHHTVLGRTRDDAAGEAFDKVAQMLDLGYPGGPPIDQRAQTGDPGFHDFPRARLDGFGFSFSGLKTSVLYYLRNLSDAERADLAENHLGDLCASFQAAIVDVLVDAVTRAVRDTGIRHVAVVGGVSANTALRKALADARDAEGFAVHVPPIEYCMDNAAMIAHAGRLRLQTGLSSAATLDINPRLTL